MDLEKIQTLIKFVAKSGVTEVELETEDFKINIKNPLRNKKGDPAIPVNYPTVPGMPQVGTQPVQVAQPQAPAPASTETPQEETKKTSTKEKDEDNNYITVKSPMIGTFYRASGPDKPEFVKVGDSVSKGQVTCIIEAMKLFNEIESEIEGTIVKVLVDDATPVEYDQPLFLVDPS